MAVDNVKGKGESQRNDNKPLIDEYRKREAEMKKHYEKQLRGIQEEHAKGISELKDENQAALTKFNNEAQNKLSRADMQRQEQVKEMARIHRNTLRKNAEEFEKRFNQQKMLSSSSIENLEDRKNEQIESVHRGYNEYIDHQRKDFTNAINQNRDDTIASITSERRQLTEKNETEKRRLEKQRFEDIRDLQNEKDAIRRNKDSQISLLEDQKWLSKADLSDKYKASIQSLNQTYAEQLTDQKTGFDAGLAEIRKNAHDTTERQQSGYDQNLSRLRQNANARTVDQINKLERQLTAEKGKHVKEEVKTRNDFRKEKREYFDQLRVREKNMLDSRNLALQDTNEKHHETIAKLNEQSTHLAERQATLYKEKSMSEAVINESKRIEAVDQVKDQLLQMNTKHKVDFTRERTQRLIDKKDLEDHYQSIMERMRKSHAEHVLDLKAENMRTQNEAINNLSRSLKETENKNESRILQQASEYQTKLQISDNDKRNSVAREHELGTQRAKATERYHLLQMKTQEIQHQNTLAQTKEKYEGQLDTLRRQIEKMHSDQMRAKT